MTIIMTAPQLESDVTIPGISTRMSEAIRRSGSGQTGRDDTTNKRDDSVPIDMSSAENWLIRPELVGICKESITEHLTEQSFNHPNGFGGEPSLLYAFAQFFNRYFHPTTTIKPTHIVTASGAGSCLDAAFFTMCDAGDSILVPAPCWNGFRFYSQAHAHVDIVFAHPKSPTEALSSAIIPSLIEAYDSAPNPARIKALVIANPHNPLGRCYTVAALQGMMSFCRDRGLHFVSDEAYALSEFGGDEPKFVSALALNHRVQKYEVIESDSIMDPSFLHVVYTMTKDFGSNGMRMGCVVSQGKRAFLDGVALASFRQTSVLSSIYTRSVLESNSLSQLIGFNKQRLAESYRTLAIVLNRCSVEFIKPSAGLYVYAHIAPWANSWEEEADVVQSLLNIGVQVNPGKAFSAAKPGWVRISFALPENVLFEALEKLERGLSHLANRRSSSISRR